MQTRNFKFIISYDGTRYFGWEHQPNTELTIQGKLERVLTEMHRAEHGTLPEKPIVVIGAGRTDAGVSARAMTANALLDTAKSEVEIQQYMNRYLPEDISVSEVRQAADRFHSRFKAAGKTYRYTLWYSGDGTKPVLTGNMSMCSRRSRIWRAWRRRLQGFAGCTIIGPSAGIRISRNPRCASWTPSGLRQAGTISVFISMETDFCKIWSGS